MQILPLAARVKNPLRCMHKTQYVASMELASHIFFHALSDPTRLRCLALLHARGELCVCELTRALGVSQPKISRHLALLRELGIVAARREGVWMHYHLHPALPAWMLEVLRIALESYLASPAGQADRAALSSQILSCSPMGLTGEESGLDKP